MQIRYVEAGDREFWFSLDRHLPEREFDEKVRNRRGYVMEEEGIPLTRRHAEDLIEEAADKAEKPSLGKRLSHLFSSKYDKNGLLILKEEHFIE